MKDLAGEISRFLFFPFPSHIKDPAAFQIHSGRQGEVREDSHEDCGFILVCWMTVLRRPPEMENALFRLSIPTW
jgi:hypothetical protein